MWLDKEKPRPKTILCLALNPDMEQQVKELVEPKIPKTIGGFEVRREEWSTPTDVEIEMANNVGAYIKAIKADASQS